MKIKIYASKPSKMLFPFFSWLIRLVQRKAYSHLAFSSEFIDGVVDMTAHGVMVNNADDFFNRYKVVKSWDLCLDITREEFHCFYEKHKNKKYAYWQNIGYILKQLGFKVNPFGKEDKKLNCSEFIMLLLKLGKYNICDSDEYDLVSTEGFLDDIS